MADLLQTPDARKAEAMRVAKQREDGIRAAAIKQGYAARDKEWCAKLGVQDVEQALQINRVIAERDARPTVEEERKHGRHQRWLGFAIGIPVGAVLACLAIFTMQAVIWDTATRAFREQAMTGAILSSHEREERGPNYPMQP